MTDLGTLILAPMEKIAEPGHQLRKKISEEGLDELGKSMAKIGLENPIKLRRTPSGYEIVSGHRRFLAAKDLGWSEIKAIVEDVDDEETNLRAIHENFHREDMSPIEEGRAVKTLMDRHGYTIKDVAKLCSKSESWVFSRLSVLEMPLELQEAVDVGALSVSAARELGGITEDEARRYYTEYAVKQGATAQLCAYWRGQWEMGRLINAPLGTDGVSAGLMPPPMEVKIPCVWCEREAPIRLIEHLRVCPKCLESLLRTKAILAQERAEGELSEREKL